MIIIQVLELFFRLFILSSLITGFCVALYVSYKVVTKNCTIKDILKHFINEKQIDSIMSLFGKPNKKMIQEHEKTIDNEKKEERFDKSNKIDIYNNKIDYMTGEDFEIFVAQILGKIGFSNIQLTKRSGDQGVDILAEKESMKYAFQCKRYDKPVGNKAVQEIFAGKFFYHCHVAIVVTNNYFTQSAKDLAHENGVVLWDRDYLQKFIGSTNEVLTENDILREYNENRGDDELRILDIEEKIVAIEDGDVSRYLYQYLESVSRTVIDTYLENENENPYINDMIKNVVKPIKLRNAKFIKIISDFHIEYLYYCKMDKNFKHTSAYKKLVESLEKNKYNDMFKIEVHYGIGDILLEGREVEFKNAPEVDINLSNMEWIKNDDVDEWETEAGYKYLVTKNFFPMKMDNIRKEKEEIKKKIEKSPDSIIEQYYYINGDFVTFSLKKENKIKILAICKNNINAANLYLSYSVKLKEEWIGKVDFSVAVNFENAVAISTNENGVEFFGGKELDGEIAIGIPRWMDKARDELLSVNEEEFLRMVEEANGYLDEFMSEVKKYIK